MKKLIVLAAITAVSCALCATLVACSGGSDSSPQAGSASGSGSGSGSASGAVQESSTSEENSNLLVELDKKYWGEYWAYVAASDKDTIPGEGKLTIDGGKFEFAFTPYDESIEPVKEEGVFVSSNTEGREAYIGMAASSEKLGVIFYPEELEVLLSAIEPLDGSEEEDTYYFLMEKGAKPPTIKKEYRGAYNVVAAYAAHGEGEFTDYYGSGEVEIGKHSVRINYASGDERFAEVNANISLYRDLDLDDSEFSYGGACSYEGYMLGIVSAKQDQGVRVMLRSDEDEPALVLVLGR